MALRPLLARNKLTKPHAGIFLFIEFQAIPDLPGVCPRLAMGCNSIVLFTSAGLKQIDHDDIENKDIQPRTIVILTVRLPQQQKISYSKQSAPTYLPWNRPNIEEKKY